MKALAIAAALVALFAACGEGGEQTAGEWQVMGDAMLPSLPDGTMVDLVEYGGAEPQRGDVIVFRSPSNPDRYFIKRIVGVPGDRIEIRDGVVYANDEPLVEPYVSGRTGLSIADRSWGQVR